MLRGRACGALLFLCWIDFFVRKISFVLSKKIFSSSLIRIGLVAEDLFAAALGDEVGLARERGDGVVEVLPEKDAARLGPLEVEGEVVLEDGWGVGEEAAVPEIGAAAVEDVDGFGAGAGALEVEAERAGGFVFSVDDDDVAGTENGFDGGGQLT